MAAKKKESMTVPQKWEDVPEIPKEEQPYPLPEGWKWVKLLNIANWGSGGTPSRKHPEYYTGKVAWLKTGELEDNEIYLTEEHITQEAINNSSARVFPINTVIIAMYGATIGKLGILKIEAATNQACACASCFNFIYYKYLFFYLLSQRDEFIKLGKGGAQPNISQEIIKNYHFPLPPFKTQQCIVNRLESLFSKLDEAAEKVQAVIDGHEARKQAILHKAFSGELTRGVEIEEDDYYKEIPEIPKEEQPYPLPEGWEWVQGKTIFCMGGNTSPTGEFFEYIDIDSIDNSRQLIKTSKRLSVKDAPSRAKRNLRNGDTIFSMVRPYLKNIAYIDEKFSACIASTGFYVCRPNEYVDSRYLFLLMTSNYVVNGLNKFMRGDNSPSIKPYHIENFAYPLPPKEVQKYIVKFLDIFCIKLNESKSIIDILLKSIYQLRISILQESFTGNFSINY